MTLAHQDDPLHRARLRWRARRGLLENDLLITRFLDKHEENLTDEEVGALSALLELSDNELLDLILARKEPDHTMQDAVISHILARLRAT